MKHLLLLFIFTLAASSCKYKNNRSLPNRIKPPVLASITEVAIDSAEVKEIQLKKLDAENIDDYIEDFFYLELETTDESLMGQYRDIELFDNKIFIHDIETKKVYIYHDDGRYISNIGQKGNGPDEMLGLHSFAINRNTNEIVAYDSFLNTFFYYTLEGQLKKRDLAPIRFSNKNFGFDSNNRCVFAIAEQNNPEFDKYDSAGLFITDSSYNINKYALFESENYLKDYAPLMLLRNKDRLAYMLKFSGDLYYIDHSKLQLKYKFDITSFENNLSVERLNSMGDNIEAQKEYLFSSSRIMAPILFSDKLIWFKFHSADNTEYYYYYNLSRDQIILFENLDNKISKKGLVFSSILAMVDDYFVGYVMPQILIDNKKQIGDLGDSILFDDNQVLVFFKLK